MQDPLYISQMRAKTRKGLDPEDIEAVRRNISTWRRKKGLTQVELAQKMGITQRVISYYENEAKTISLDAISAIARSLEIPTERLLRINGSNQEPLPLPKALQRRVEILRKLSPKAQKTISDLIDALKRSEEN